MNDFKVKVERFKAIIKDFDKLEKSVQAKLMGVADRLAPQVQGGGIAPKEIRVPEPKEYPDIKEEVVSVAGVKKHDLEVFADQFSKSDWHPVAKTQKNPSTTVPFEEKPTHREYIAPTNNVTGQLKADRDSNNSKSPEVPAELHASGAMTKAEMHAARPATTAIKPPQKNPTEVQPPKNSMGKNWAYNWSR